MIHINRNLELQIDLGVFTFEKDKIEELDLCTTGTLQCAYNYLYSEPLEDECVSGAEEQISNISINGILVIDDEVIDFYKSAILEIRSDYLSFSDIATSYEKQTIQITPNKNDEFFENSEVKLKNIIFWMQRLGLEKSEIEEIAGGNVFDNINMDAILESYGLIPETISGTFSSDTYGKNFISLIEDASEKEVVDIDEAYEINAEMLNNCGDGSEIRDMTVSIMERKFTIELGGAVKIENLDTQGVMKYANDKLRENHIPREVVFLEDAIVAIKNFNENVVEVV
jgi:hypothetical protein